MLKTIITIDENSNPAETLAKFRQNCKDSELSDPEELIAEVQSAVEELAQRGSELVAIGSQFEISRNLSGSNYHVTLQASFGVKRGLIGKLRSFLSS